MMEYVYAQHDFVPMYEDEISLHAGDCIEVIEKDDLYGDGWWQGRNLAGKVGLFPKNYTQPSPPMPPSAPLSPAQPKGVRCVKAVLSGADSIVEYVYAQHDFVPEHEDEIAFRAGDRIEVVEKDDLYGDGWWQGRNLEGKVGLFPEIYTQPAPSSTKPPPAPPATAPLISALADTHEQ